MVNMHPLIRGINTFKTSSDGYEHTVLFLDVGTNDCVNVAYLMDVAQYRTMMSRLTAVLMSRVAAVAVMPYLKLPTNQDQLGNNSVEGGLILPLAVKLPSGWDMGIMTQFDLNRDLNGPGRHVEFINSITFAHDLVGKLGGYVEFFSSASTEAGAPWVGTFDVGLTFGLTDNIQLDAGVNLGITRAAEDVNPFLGLSWRF